MSEPVELLTAAELTVLGLVVEEPRHGYDIEQIVERRGIRRWTDIGFSSIYYLLDKLERRGLVHATASDSEGKSRRVFTATAAGRALAKSQATAFIADARSAPRPILVGLANLELLTEDDYIGALRVRVDRLNSQIDAVSAARDEAAALTQSAAEVFSYSLTMLVAERDWLWERLTDGSET